MLGLGAGQCVEIGGQVEGMPGRADGFGQRFVREIYGLISHPAIIGDGLTAVARSPIMERDTLTP